MTHSRRKMISVVVLFQRWVQMRLIIHTRLHWLSVDASTAPTNKADTFHSNDAICNKSCDAIPSLWSYLPILSTKKPFQRYFLRIFCFVSSLQSYFVFSGPCAMSLTMLLGCCQSLQLVLRWAAAADFDSSDFQGQAAGFSPHVNRRVCDCFHTVWIVVVTPGDFAGRGNIEETVSIHVVCLHAAITIM